MADTYAGGHGTTIAFTTSGLVAPMRLIGATQMTRGKVNIGGSLSDERLKYAPAGLSDPGEFDIEFLFNVSCASYATFMPDIDAVAEVVTITYPTPSGYSTDANLAGTAFFVAVTYPEAVSEDVLLASGTLAWEGGDDEPVLTPAVS